MTRLDAKYDEALYDDIIAEITPSPLVTSVKLDESETPLKRGTVLVASSPGGNCKPASQALTATDALYILAENLDKADSGEATVAYKAGNFVKGRLVTDGSYELVAADYDLLRKSGIFVRDMIEDAGLEQV